MQTMKSTFLYQDTQLPAYLQFPEFLLRLPISQTAKVVYLVLYDRSRLSMKNEWTDEYGRVYVVFPIVELAKKIGKSESTVKAGMKELCEAGLLVKRSGGFSKPNYLYVKYALETTAKSLLSLIHRCQIATQLSLSISCRPFISSSSICLVETCMKPLDSIFFSSRWREGLDTFICKAHLVTDSGIGMIARAVCL